MVNDRRTLEDGLDRRRNEETERISQEEMECFDVTDSGTPNNLQPGSIGVLCKLKVFLNNYEEFLKTSPIFIDNIWDVKCHRKIVSEQGQ